jgi:hypothetical protein
LQRVAYGWGAAAPGQELLPLDRLEYLFEITQGDETVTLQDPGSPSASEVQDGREGSRPGAGAQEAVT